MAARENQGLHIALILFVMLTALLALLCYFTFTSANEKADQLANRTDELATQKNAADAYRTQAEVLKMYIGFGNMTAEDAAGQLEYLTRIDPDVSADMAPITAAYESDMALFDAAYPGVKNYRSLPEHLVQTITTKNGVIAEGEAATQTWITKRDTDVSAADERASVAEQLAADREADLRTRTEEFKTASDDIQDEQIASAQRVTDANTARQTTITESTDQINTLTSVITERETTIQEQAELLAQYQAEEFDIADGQITEVSARANIVWINVGFADNLPQNATFSVYPQDSAQFRDEGVKATIEVKRILGDHYAECEVTSETASDPIVSGDVINTTTWSPGRQQAFGIAGFIDIDGDGRSDATRLRNIITRNGGNVVAYIDEDGNLQGEINAKTRYLITGDDFRVGVADEGTLQKMINATTDLNNQARDEAVEKKYFQDLLEEMGFRGEPAVQGVGSERSNGFAPRRPPARGNNGAF